MSTGTMMYGVPNGKRSWQKFPLHVSMLQGCDLFMTSTPVHDEKKTLGGGGSNDFPHLERIYFVACSDLSLIQNYN